MYVKENLKKPVYLSVYIQRVSKLLHGPHSHLTQSISVPETQTHTTSSNLVTFDTHVNYGMVDPYLGPKEFKRFNNMIFILKL